MCLSVSRFLSFSSTLSLVRAALLLRQSQHKKGTTLGVTLPGSTRNSREQSPPELQVKACRCRELWQMLDTRGRGKKHCVRACARTFVALAYHTVASMWRSHATLPLCVGDCCNSNRQQRGSLCSPAPCLLVAHLVSVFRVLCGGFVHGLVHTRLHRSRQAFGALKAMPYLPHTKSRLRRRLNTPTPLAALTRLAPTASSQTGWGVGRGLPAWIWVPEEEEKQLEMLVARRRRMTGAKSGCDWFA